MTPPRGAARGRGQQSSLGDTHEGKTRLLLRSRDTEPRAAVTFGCTRLGDWNGRVSTVSVAIHSASEKNFG